MKDTIAVKLFDEISLKTTQDKETNDSLKIVSQLINTINGDQSTTIMNNELIVDEMSLVGLVWLGLVDTYSASKPIISKFNPFSLYFWRKS